VKAFIRNGVSEKVVHIKTSGVTAKAVHIKTIL